ncbi:hypothetical protein SAMN05216389_10976 [Oceanobacillus limi]|uniref:Flp pilus-assembly TadE/G-like n=1 Tax=Oceanobacillus limi TaxID=930131 RepID=A0A1I0DPN6_9BACI|nr:hypothetical protein [Oceanobacillus limi]SET34340.1 hypothetical protein SAMN05216389_10976 [Oceanobacillus limi]
MKQVRDDVIHSENGNVALFVLGMLSIIMVLFLVVANLGSVLATKEKSDMTSSQASLTATSVFYEEVRDMIEGTSYTEPVEPTEPTPPDEDAENYDELMEAYEEAMEEYDELYDEYLEELEIYEFFDQFDDKVAERRDGLIGSLPDWTLNELDLEALDQVLENALTSGGPVQEALEDLLVGSIDNAVIQAAIATIEQNNGELEGAKLDIQDNRIFIKSANEMESTSYNGILEGIQEKIYQESAGPEIGFINYIWNRNTPIELEDE